MLRFLLTSLAIAISLNGNLYATGEKGKPPKDTPKHTPVTITKIDTKMGEITVKYTAGKSKERQETFALKQDVKIFDETGRVVTIDVFESGSEALILTEEGHLKELRRP